MISEDYQRALDDVATLFERNRDQWLDTANTEEWDPMTAHAYTEGARVLRAWATEPWRMERALAAAARDRELAAETVEPECNGICLTASDLGVPGDGVAYAHPDCELHGHPATNNVDGSPR